MSPKLVLFCILLCLMGSKCSEGKCEVCFPCQKLYSFTLPASIINNMTHQTKATTMTSAIPTTTAPLQLALIQDNESESFSWPSNIRKVANNYGGLLLVACIFQLLILNILQLCRRDKNPSKESHQLYDRFVSLFLVIGRNDNLQMCRKWEMKTQKGSRSFAITTPVTGAASDDMTIQLMTNDNFPPF
ncbi:unnamed protein product [Orchesella dallaii]|uniref:Uncharacterized protein n=1 Tax=Orchesella dallaii TaxID=48710 RepID=A0ABP1RB24_9HEXA